VLMVPLAVILNTNVIMGFAVRVLFTVTIALAVFRAAIRLPISLFTLKMYTQLRALIAENNFADGVSRMGNHVMLMLMIQFWESSDVAALGQIAWIMYAKIVPEQGLHVKELRNAVKLGKSVLEGFAKLVSNLVDFVTMENPVVKKVNVVMEIVKSALEKRKPATMILIVVKNICVLPLTHRAGIVKNVLKVKNIRKFISSVYL